MVECVLRTRWPLEYITRMDVLTFNALMQRMNKSIYGQKAEAAWLACATVNAGMSGKTKAVQKFTDAYEKAAGQKAANADDFIRDFGLAGGGKI